MARRRKDAKKKEAANGAQSGSEKTPPPLRLEVKPDEAGETPANDVTSSPVGPDIPE